jgi:K(+)-stimulated pyrophosphate-energized sodium pump
MEEDDPRNAAVIADLVGDNVGDCAGMAADIFESYEVAIVASLILGLTLAAMTGHNEWIIIPLLVRGVGVISTIIGTYAVSFWKGRDAESAMFLSYELSSVITIVSAILLSYFFGPENDLRMGILVGIGVALAVAFNPLTAYATSASSPRVQAISAASPFGPALVILEGMTLGYLSSVWSVMLVVAALACSVLAFSVDFPDALDPIALYGSIAAAVGLFIWRGIMQKNPMEGIFFAMWAVIAGLFLTSMSPVTAWPTPLVSPIPGLTLEGAALDNFANFAFVLFGVSLIGVGMLSLTGNNVSMDAFGPIADNANGIGEVAGMDEGARQIMADLDAAGNTTKAITKGVAIASAVIAALSLYGAFYTDILRVLPAEALATFNLADLALDLSRPIVFIGLLIGGALPLLLGGLLIKAVNRSAAQIMAEVRRQLRIPEIWAGTRRPEYAHAVAISTKAAQSELIPIGVIAVFAPIVVGLMLGHLALGGFLAGVILSGMLLAVFMANAGGAWDNAKKYVEDGHFGGKRTSNHAATVVGDTVGDPLKDTAGPALNPMIKVMNLVALIIAPIIVQSQYSDSTVTPYILWGIVLVGIVAILWAVRRSDRPTPQATGDEKAFSASEASAD